MMILTDANLWSCGKNNLMARKIIFVALGLFAALATFAAETQSPSTLVIDSSTLSRAPYPENSNTASRLMLDMVHNNPGEPLQGTAFRNPKYLAGLGYNGQVIMAGADSCETFDAIAPDILPKDGPERAWIEKRAVSLEKSAESAHAAGIKAYAFMQFIVLPKALVARYKTNICDEQGRIDLERPVTQKILRAQVDELFDRCPALDGIVVRTGEIYLFDSPYHTATGNDTEKLAQSATAIIHGPDSHVALVNLLRDEACVKRGKLVLYRTWDFGNNFHINPEYYLKVTDAIAPYSNLVFSIKYTKGDFFRMTPFNPTLGIGKHRQIVEVECQPEYYGKGAHPDYVGDGVINGCEEYATIMETGKPRGLRDLVGNANYCGVWTWSRGGGWEGPFIQNELWCALNAYVIAKYAEDPRRTEKEVFDEFATQRLGLTGEDVARFRELNLLSAAAVLRGNLSYHGKVNLTWARDHFMAAPDLKFFVTNHLADQVLAEKAESVSDWQKIESLAKQIHFPDAKTQEFVEVSSAYGRFKYSIIEQAWRVLLYGSGPNTNCEKIATAICRYDRLWADWRQLRQSHPDACATLYKDVAFHEKPGIGAAVNTFRDLCVAYQPPLTNSGMESATIPSPRLNPTNTTWLDRHAGFVRQASAGGVDLLFLGDSITDNWRRSGSNVWNEYYAPRHAANFGIGGDRTQHVLWRIERGELQGINPKVVVLMIGTNNGKADSADDIAMGIEEIVSEIRLRLPQSKILLLGVFPRNRAGDPPALMPALRAVNEKIAGLDDGGRTIRYLDIGSKFLGPDGKVPSDLMPDYLHPNERGYRVWAEALEPVLAEMMK